MKFYGGVKMSKVKQLQEDRDLNLTALRYPWIDSPSSRPSKEVQGFMYRYRQQIDLIEEQSKSEHPFSPVVVAIELEKLQVMLTMLYHMSLITWDMFKLHTECITKIRITCK